MTAARAAARAMSNVSDRFESYVSSYVSRVQSRAIDSLVWLFAVLHALRFSLGPDLANYPLRKYFDDRFEQLQSVDGAFCSTKKFDATFDVSKDLLPPKRRPALLDDCGRPVDDDSIVVEEAPAVRPALNRASSSFAPREISAEDARRTLDEEGRGRNRSPRLLWRSRVDKATLTLLDFGQEHFNGTETPRPRLRGGRITIEEGKRWSEALDRHGL